MIEKILSKMLAKKLQLKKKHEHKFFVILFENPKKSLII